MPPRSEDVQRLTRLAVQKLVDDWSHRSGAFRPWGMWLMLSGAITTDEELNDLHSSVPLRAAWFVTESGFVRREEWETLRFRTLRQTEKLNTGVGIFEVAPYREQAAVYASAVYGALNAYGFRMEFDSDGQPVARRLWVS